MVLVASVLAACPGGNTVPLVAEDSSGSPVIPVAALLMSTVGAPSWRKCQLLIPKIARFMVNTEKESLPGDTIESVDIKVSTRQDPI